MMEPSLKIGSDPLIYVCYELLTPLLFAAGFPSAYSKSASTVNSVQSSHGFFAFGVNVVDIPCTFKISD
jgi:hypothetical protein